MLASVQILRTNGVISGPLHSTTCLPLFTSTVVQAGTELAAEEVLVETILKVALSGKTSKACACVSTQNWHSTSIISWPVTGIPGVWVVPTFGDCVGIVCVLRLPVLTVAVSNPVAGEVSTVETVSELEAVGVVTVVSAGRIGVLVGLLFPGRSVATMLVGDVPCCAPHAAVNNTRIRTMNKGKREIFIILLFTFS